MPRSALCVLCLLLGFVISSCRSKPAPPRRGSPPPAPSASAKELRPHAVAEVERQLRASQLRLPPRRRHAPRLVFVGAALARIRDDVVEVLDGATLEPLDTFPLQQPRALLPMVDGSLVAVGSSGVVRWERGRRPTPPAARPLLLPGSEIYADAQQSDVLWVFEPDSAPPSLSSYRLVKGAPPGLLLPEQRILLASPRGGTFGVTREGVWIYVTSGSAERFAPGGLKLPGLSLAGASAPSWVLPSRRLDQAAWLDESGALSRALVSPSFKLLGSSRTPGAPFAAEVGDEGRLLAIVTVTGPGPRFELLSFDAELAERGRAVLRSEPPSSAEDWVRLVTRNQELAVSPREGRVAVGGPDRLALFDDRAAIVLSIPIR